MSKTDYWKKQYLLACGERDKLKEKTKKLGKSVEDLNIKLDHNWTMIFIIIASGIAILVFIVSRIGFIMVR